MLSGVLETNLLCNCFLADRRGKRETTTRVSQKKVHPRGHDTAEQMEKARTKVRRECLNFLAVGKGSLLVPSRLASLDSK